MMRFLPLSKKVASATAELGKRVEICNEKVRNNEVPLLELSRLQELNAEPQDLVVALGHFNYENSFQCKRDARLALAYEVGTLTAAKRHLHQQEACDQKDGFIIAISVINPSFLLFRIS